MKRLYGLFVLFILLGLSVSLGLVIFDGRLVNFLNPKMHVLVKVLFAFVVTGFVFKVLSFIRKKDVEVDFKWSHVSYAILLVPVVFIGMNPSALSDETLSNRARNFQSVSAEESSRTTGLGALVGGSSGASDVVSSEPVTSIEELQAQYALVEGDTFVDTLLSLNSGMLSVGDSVTLEGFVHKDQANGDLVAVSRLLMSCCVADAVLYGIFTDIPSDSVQSGQNSWVRVTGTVSRTRVLEPFSNTYIEVFYLEGSQFDVIPAYPHPYVYY